MGLNSSNEACDARLNTRFPTEVLPNLEKQAMIPSIERSAQQVLASAVVCRRQHAKFMQDHQGRFPKLQAEYLPLLVSLFSTFGGVWLAQIHSRRLMAGKQRFESDRCRVENAATVSRLILIPS
jgi:hypothetical protein